MARTVVFQAAKQQDQTSEREPITNHPFQGPESGMRRVGIATAGLGVGGVAALWSLRPGAVHAEVGLVLPLARTRIRHSDFSTHGRTFAIPGQVVSVELDDVAAARRHLAVDGAVIIKGVVQRTRDGHTPAGDPSSILPRIQRLLVANPQIPPPAPPVKLGGPRRRPREERPARYVQSSAGRYHMSLLENVHHNLAEEIQETMPWHRIWEPLEAKRQQLATVNKRGTCN